MPDSEKGHGKKTATSFLSKHVLRRVFEVCIRLPLMHIRHQIFFCFS